MKVLGDAVAAVILHGSLVLGDYVPGRSDIDLLMIAEQALRDAETRALLHLAEAERPEASCHVDLRVVTRAASARPTPDPPLELYVRFGPSGALEVEQRKDAERDLVVELSVCRATGRSIVGPEPTAVIGEVPDEWVDSVGIAQLDDWLALEYEPRYGALMAFTACRVWHFAEERRHVSKPAAAAWALARDPTLPAVREAVAQRLDPSVELPGAAVLDLLARIRARIGRG